MSTVVVELSDLSIRLGSYEIFLNHIGHSDPRVPWHITPHVHTLYELHYISVGSGILYTPTECFEMTPGTTCLTGPGIYHGQTSECENSMDEFCLRFTIEHSAIHGERDESELVEAIISNPFFVVKDDIGCQMLISSMLDEAFTGFAGYKKRLTFLLGELIIALGRRMLDIDMNNIELSQNSLKIGNIDLKSRLDAYFFTYDTPASIDSIISDLHITRRHFSRLMQKYYGMSYTEKITELRIGYAKQLLCGNMSIADIASVIGYGTTQQFIKKFRLATGMTPGEFRRNIGKTK